MDDASSYRSVRPPTFLDADAAKWGKVRKKFFEAWRRTPAFYALQLSSAPAPGFKHPGVAELGWCEPGSSGCKRPNASFLKSTADKTFRRDMPTITSPRSAPRSPLDFQKLFFFLLDATLPKVSVLTRPLRRRDSPGSPRHGVRKLGCRRPQPPVAFFGRNNVDMKLHRACQIRLFAAQQTRRCARGTPGESPDTRAQHRVSCCAQMAWATSTGERRKRARERMVAVACVRFTTVQRVDDPGQRTSLLFFFRRDCHYIRRCFCA